MRKRESAGVSQGLSRLPGPLLVSKAKEAMMRTGSAPNFCPPVEEGLVYELEDENGDTVELEFLGLIINDDGRRYGFFFLVTEDEPALSSGEVVVLEVTAVDEDDQPEEFEFVEDEAIAEEAYQAFKIAAKDLYDFE